MPKINNEYDIGKAFAAIEDELISSMIRNMERHKVDEVKEDKQWSMWQAEQLKSLEAYRKNNQKKFKQQFSDINVKIEELIRTARDEGEMDQEISILNAVKKGFPAERVSQEAAAEFFKVNDRKLNSLIDATVKDMEKAETAVLRMANDQYRKIIYNAQVYANTGAGTYEKAVDMATKDFLSAGINCIQYANGARHTIADYADMAIRTASKRAYLQGEGQKRQEWGIHTVIVNKRGNPCPKCLPFVGKVLIDDVWSGGSQKDGNYPLMSTAIAAGLYHPRCKDSHTTYFPGISTADDTWTEKELEAIGLNASKEAKQQYVKRQEKRFERLARFSLDEENQKRYAARREEWKRRHAETITENPVVDEPKADLKTEIGIINDKKAGLQEKIRGLENEEKSLTQKVYFDLTGTAEETEQLRKVSKNKQELLKKIKELEGQILEKQEIYKSAAEARILKDGIVKEIKLSKKMTPASVDMLEDTLRNLKERYGIMPEGVVYSPLKVPDGTAAYDWLDDKLYLSNRFSDVDGYLDIVKQSESSLVEYRKHNRIEEMSKERMEKAEKVLADRSIKGYEREKAVLGKADAEININIARQAVREDLSDVLVHEYGHFIHRHANVDYVQKKNVFGMKTLGGKIVGGDWKYEINTRYSRAGKVEASKISKYAAENPYETFAEGFLAMHKGEKIPDGIEKVITEAMQKSNAKPIAKTADAGIMELYRKTDDARNSFKFISDETFNNLTISARKKGAVIIRGTREAEEHLERQGAAASNIGDVLIFRKDVCISEVLEETYHFEQNTLKMNNDKTEPLRSILNEIDAKQYLLENADKYKIPRNEIELTKRQLEAYQQQLEEYGKDVK